MRHKTLTIRGVDSGLYKRLQGKAKKEGRSINQVVIDSLRKYYGLEKEKKYTEVYNDLDHLFGTWTEDEYETIQGEIEAQRKIDPDLWSDRNHAH